MTYTVKVTQTIEDGSSEAVALITGIKHVDLYREKGEVIGVALLNIDPRYNYYILTHNAKIARMCAHKLISRLMNPASMETPNFAEVQMVGDVELAGDISRN